jgi:hypothetical protein
VGNTIVIVRFVLHGQLLVQWLYVHIFDLHYTHRYCSLHSCTWMGHISIRCICTVAHGKYQQRRDKVELCADADLDVHLARVSMNELWLIEQK